MITHNYSTHSVLIIGAGSIGRRHARNLRALGMDQWGICDPDRERLTPIHEELNIPVFTDIHQACLEVAPDIVFICTPPACHVKQALQAVQHDAHLFIEKPLSNSSDGIEKLLTEIRSRGRVAQIGYNLRFHPGLQHVKRLLDEGRIGQILWAQAEFGQYLPDWRPWQDYRQSYTARKELGGGIIFDSSHELDYISWLIGSPSHVMCVGGTVSSLDVDVEDCVTVLLRFPDNVHADIHLDFIQRAYSRSCKLVGEQGTIIWDYPQNHIRLYQAETTTWETISYQFEPNQMYIAEIEHFLSCIELQTPPVIGIEQGYQTVKTALAAHRSRQEGRWVTIE